MAWTSPKTYIVGDPLTAAEMNTYQRDNMNALKTPPEEAKQVNEGADYTTASATFVDVDATDLSLSVTTTGGDLMIGFYGSFLGSALMLAYLNVVIDEAVVALEDGMVVQTIDVASAQVVSFVHIETGVSPGAHTIKLQWKASGGTATMYAGAGTANADVHPQFWAREI